MNPSHLTHDPSTYRRGYVATAKGFVHWTQVPTAGQGHGAGVIPPARETVSVDWESDPIRKRSRAARLEEVTNRIFATALGSFAQVGFVSLPKSVVDDICHESWLRGEPMTRAQIEALAENEIRPMCEKYAAAVLHRVARKGQTNDLTPVVGAGNVA